MSLTPRTHKGGQREPTPPGSPIATCLLWHTDSRTNIRYTHHQKAEYVVPVIPPPPLVLSFESLKIGFQTKAHGKIFTGAKRGCNANDQELMPGEEKGPINVECHLATKRRALRMYVTKSMVTLLLPKKETWRVHLCKISKEDKPTKTGERLWLSEAGGEDSL